MPKFSIHYEKPEEGKSSGIRFSADLESAKIDIAVNKDGSLDANWEGDIGTVKSVVEFLRSQFPDFGFPDLPGIE